MHTYEASLSLPDDVLPSDLRPFSRRFVAAIEFLDDSGDEDTVYEAARAFREAFEVLQECAASTEIPSADGGSVVLSNTTPKHSVVEVGYTLEEVLQTGGAATVFIRRHQNEILVTVRDEMPDAPTARFTPGKQTARTPTAPEVADAVAPFLPPTDDDMPPWEVDAARGLLFGVRRNHPWVTVATNALEGQPGLCGRIRQRLGTFRHG